MGVNAFRTTSPQEKSRKARTVPTKETMEETAMKVFEQITDAWGFDEEQKVAALGLKSADHLKDLQENPSSLTEKQVDKISYILNIFRVLRALHGSEESADDFFQHTHEKKIVLGVNNKTPLQSVLSGSTNDLEKLLNYLVEFRTF